MTYNKNYQQALNTYKGSPFEALLKQTHDEYKTIIKNNVRHDETAVHNFQQQMHMAMIQPVQNVANTYSTLTNLDYKMDNNLNGRAFKMGIKLRGASSTDIRLNIGRMQTLQMLNGMSEIGETITVNSIYYFDLALMNDPKTRKQILELMNTNKNYIIGMYDKTMTGGVTYDFYLFFDCFLTRNLFPMNQLKNSGLTLRLIPNPSTTEWCISGTYTNITMESMNLYILLLQQPDEIQGAYDTQFENYEHHYVYSNLIEQQTTETLTTSVEKSIRLAGIHGLISGLLFNVRPSKSTFYAENFAALGDDCKIAIKNKIGEPIGNVNNFTVGELRKFVNTGAIGKYLANHTNMLYFPISDNLDTVQNGEGNRGVIQFTGDEQLFITPSATNNAESSRVLKILTYLGTTGIENVCTGGMVKYKYSSKSHTSETVPIAFNETNTNLDIALNNLVGNDGIIISTATGIDDAAGLVCTISNMTKYNEKYGGVGTIHITAEGCPLFNATPALCVCQTTITTAGTPQAGLYGASGGSYFVYVGAIRLSKVSLYGGKVKFFHG
jgi:hypothetical protein